MRGVLPPHVSASPSAVVVADLPPAAASPPPRPANHAPWFMMLLSPLPPPPPPAALPHPPPPHAVSLAPTLTLGALALVLLGALLLINQCAARSPAARTSLRSSISGWLGMHTGGKEEGAALTQLRARPASRRPRVMTMAPASDSGGEADVPLPRPSGPRLREERSPP